MPQTFQTSTQPRAAVPGAPGRGEPLVRHRATASDADPAGTVAGARIRSLMETAAAAAATETARGPVVIVAVSKIALQEPVLVGDEICCHVETARIGTSSITLTVEVLALRRGRGDPVGITAADYTYMAVDRDGRPRPVLELGPEADRRHDPAVENAAGATPWTPPT